MPHPMDSTKPMLACDWNPQKLKFPLWVQPKIDGVRALNLTGRCTGRSLKEHGNRHVTEFFSAAGLQGLDGEMAAERETHPDLCRLTTSAISTADGQPWLRWHVFDLINTITIAMPYAQRYDWLRSKLDNMPENNLPAAPHLRLVPYKEILSLDAIYEAHAEYVEAGYEGTILRNPYGPYKSGRCTATECNLLRIKDFTEEEAIVEGLEEGRKNLNEATTNELGHTERSTHQDNMVPNGMIGTLLCKDIKTGQPVRVGAGRLTHAERVHYLQNPGEILGRVVKYKTMPHGKKDKPRFSPFQSFRAESDM